MGKENSQQRSLMLMVLCGFCWSTSSVMIKLCSWSSFQLVSVRAFIAGFFLLGYLYFFEKKKLVTNKTVIIVAVFVCFKYIGFVTANKLTAGANTVALLQTSTVYILIANCIIAKKMPRKMDIAVIIVTVFGIGLFFYGKFDATSILGNVLAGMAGLCTAVLFFASGRFSSFEENLSAIIWGNFMAAIICGFTVFGEPLDLSFTSVGAVLYLALIQQGVAFIFYTKAIRVISPFACAIIATIEPILSPFLCFLFLGEKPSRYAAIGAVVVIGAVTAWSFADFKAKKKINEVNI